MTDQRLAMVKWSW